MTDASKLINLLIQKKLKIATAESCTGGMLSSAITAISGSSAVFECSVIAYANRIKQEILGVEADILEKYGAVSEQTALAMAEGILQKAQSDIAVSITGIAGPSSDNTSKPVGLIYICVKNQEKALMNKYETSFFVDIRNQNRSFAVAKALEAAESFIRDNY